MHPRNTFFFLLVETSSLRSIADQFNRSLHAIDRSRCGFALIAEHTVLSMLPRPAVDSWFGRIDQSRLAREADAFLACILSGRIWASPADLVSLLGEEGTDPRQHSTGPIPHRRALPHRRLTKRQGEVARLVAEGAANKEIADLLGIGLHTVKSHVSAAMAAFDVNNRTELAVNIRRSGERMPVPLELYGTPPNIRHGGEHLE